MKLEYTLLGTALTIAILNLIFKPEGLLVWIYFVAVGVMIISAFILQYLRHHEN